MTRKEQKEERRQKILMTALTLFVEQGYYDTKITDIAATVPMSTGLMFHYFESKEELLLELVRMGAAGTKSAGGAGAPKEIPADVYLENFLKQLFSYAKEQPWVFNMFVLMGQVRRSGMPEEARQVALSVDTIDTTAKLIKKGQKEGIFREGNTVLLSRCFWASVQGIMEEMAMDKEMNAPDPKWIMGMLLKSPAHL
ncbi:MAG: TetR/AcrR family transcriptional regulator [Lachnospiraceae bacterium]|nr:TetR/AcrR family transcriptional regulator [Lachnospiraceae bacterium]